MIFAGLGECGNQPTISDPQRYAKVKGDGNSPQIIENEDEIRAINSVEWRHYIDE